MVHPHVVAIHFAVFEFLRQRTFMKAVAYAEKPASAKQSKSAVGEESPEINDYQPPKLSTTFTFPYTLNKRDLVSRLRNPPWFKFLTLRVND